MAEMPVYFVERRQLSQRWFQPERQRAVKSIRLLNWDDPVSARQQAGFFAFSLILHGLLFSAGWHFPSHRVSNSAIEVDLAGPYEIVPPNTAALARPARRGNSEGPSEGRKPQVAERFQSAQMPGSTGATHQQHSDDQQVRRGSLTGIDEGEVEVALVSLTAIPQLLNAKDVQAMMRAYFPENERLAGHEGRVTLDLHIDANGFVPREDIIVSAGDAFDQAALKIASLLKFRPARVGDKPVPVKLRQSISFRLD